MKTPGINNISMVLLTELQNDINFILQKAGDGLKGRPGTPAVRHFLQEVKLKIRAMLEKIKGQEERKLAEGIVIKLEEALAGSYTDIENKVRAAVRKLAEFPEKQGERYIGGPYLPEVFPDYAIVEYDTKFYKISYGIVNGEVVLGKKIEVEQTYVPVTESAVVIKEATLSEVKESQAMDFQVADFVSLQEAKFNADFSEVEVVLIEQGCNEQKKRYYPDKTIREAAPIFKGFKMYIDHPTPTEEKERPERSLKNWASTIVESHYEDGKAIGKVAVHDTWLRERLADPVARQHIGLSILAGGKISVGKVNGKEGYQIVEAIIPARKNGPPSVDWVTEAGARGRVSKLLESQRSATEKGSKMEIGDLTLTSLKESRKDLVELIEKEAKSGNAAEVTKLQTQLKEAQDKIAAFEKDQQISKQVTLAESILKEKKLPDASKEKVIAAVKANVITGDISEAVGKLVQTELEYVNKITGNGKIKTSAAGSEATLIETLGKALDTRAGVEEVKEKK